MGYQAHKILTVTCWKIDDLRLAHTKATEIFAGCEFDLVSEIAGPFVNGQATFTVAPDGSKEGWSESDDVDALLEDFLEWLTAYRVPEPWNYMPFQWGLYQFAADDLGDVWAVGNRHLLGRVPKQWKTFAFRPDGNEREVSEGLVLTVPEGMTDEELCQQTYDDLCADADRVLGKGGA